MKALIKLELLIVLIALVFACNGNDDNSPVNMDTDEDGIINTNDNCAATPNPNQEDIDNDGVGDVCDDDRDGDGILNENDNCPDNPNPNQEDTDDDGIGDLCDSNTDSDNDGVSDETDNCPNTPNPNQEDSDNDGIGDACELTAKCVDGMAGDYPCLGFDLVAQIPLSELGGSSGNDSWGWTDTTTGKEYALIGTNASSAFVDISNPEQPIVVGILPTATESSSWRDIKVYNNHAFIVSEAFGHGMQVFDLTRLRNINNPPVTFSANAILTDFGSAHNIVINEDSGYAYVVGARESNSRAFVNFGGPIFINIQNPTDPFVDGGYSQNAYSHDAQVVNYNGPDTDYTGQEIYIGSNENEMVIVNVTDKSNPVEIATIGYSNIGYTHQGWFTNDMRYFLLGDELDEINFGVNSKTIVFDFEDLDNPSVLFDYFGPSTAIDHNGYVNGNMFYLANYTAGFRAIDISGIASSNITEVGYFDTHPQSNNTTFNGAWNVYPYFESGNIIISDIENGLFIVRASE